MKQILLITSLYLLISCSPKVTSQIIEHQQRNDGQVIVLTSNKDIPLGSKKLGSFSIKPRYLSTTKSCKLDNLLDEARKSAKEIGGNALLITRHTAPSITNSKHSIEVEVYTIDLPVEEKINCHSLEYASIWLYRYMWAADFRYDVYVDNNKVYSSIGGTKTEVRIKKAGRYTIWATTGGKKVSLILDIELGKDYYVESTIWAGVITPNPLLIPVSNTAGQIAMEEIEDTLSIVQ